MECPATPPNIADCERLRTPSPSKHDLLNSSQKRQGSSRSVADIVDDTSSNNDDEKEQGSDTQTKKERPRSPDPSCAICLGQIENMSYTDSCFHKFCFTCLLEWSKVRIQGLVYN